MFNFLKKSQPSNIQTLTLNIQGMHCTSCSLNIDGELESTPGVIESNTSYAKAQTKITYDPQKTNSTELSQIITKLGYQVTIK